jgi:hypothetical protein
MTTEITTLDDLSFVIRDDDDIRIDWHPVRRTHSPTAAMEYGRLCAMRELAQLAEVDEHDAYMAITRALTSRTRNTQCGEEVGMIDGLARLAMIGLRALSATQEMPFSTLFDPHHSEWCSLHRQVDVMQAQFKALKIKPWRTYGQAGMG